MKFKLEDEMQPEQKLNILEPIATRFYAEWLRACADRDKAEKKVHELEAQLDNERANFKQRFDHEFGELKRRASAAEQKATELEAQVKNLQAQLPQFLDRLRDNHMAKSVDELDLSVRAANCLQALGIETVGQLVKTSFHRLLSQKHLNKKVLEEIRTELGKLGLKLRGDK